MKLRAHFDLSNKQRSSQDEKAADDDNGNGAEMQEERSEMRQLKNPYYNPSSSPPQTLGVYIAAVKNSITKLWKSNKPVTDNLTQE